MVDETSIKSKLDELKGEIIERVCLDQDGKKIVKKFYRDSTIMAEYDILLKETIGRGKFSKIVKSYKVGFGDVAVKIIDVDKAPNNYKENFLKRELC